MSNDKTDKALNLMWRAGCDQEVKLKLSDNIDLIGACDDLKKDIDNNLGRDLPLKPAITMAYGAARVHQMQADLVLKDLLKSNDDTSDQEDKTDKALNLMWRAGCDQEVKFKLSDSIDLIGACEDLKKDIDKNLGRDLPLKPAITIVYGAARVHQMQADLVLKDLLKSNDDTSDQEYKTDKALNLMWRAGCDQEVKFKLSDSIDLIGACEDLKKDIDKNLGRDLPLKPAITMVYGATRVHQMQADLVLKDLLKSNDDTSDQEYKTDKALNLMWRAGCDQEVKFKLSDSIDLIGACEDLKKDIDKNLGRDLPLKPAITMVYGAARVHQMQADLVLKDLLKSNDDTSDQEYKTDKALNLMWRAGCDQEVKFKLSDSIDLIGACDDLKKDIDKNLGRDLPLKPAITMAYGAARVHQMQADLVLKEIYSKIDEDYSEDEEDIIMVDL